MDMYVPSNLRFRCLDFEMSTWGNIEKVKLVFKWFSICAGTVSCNLIKKIQKIKKQIWNFEREKIMKFGYNSEIESWFWNLVTILKDRNSEIWLKIRNLVQILNFGPNYELVETTKFGWIPEIGLHLVNCVEILKFGQNFEIRSNFWGKNHE